MLISLRAYFVHILIQLWSPTFQFQMFFFLQHLSKPLDKCGSSFSLPHGMPLITHTPVPLATGLPRLSQRDPCQNKGRVRLSHPFNAKTQSEAVRKTLRQNKEYFCSCPSSPPPATTNTATAPRSCCRASLKATYAFVLEIH